MIENAIAKVKTEMDGNKNNSYIQVVGQFLLQHLEANPADAEKIMTADKTISKSLDAMRKAAEKKKTGNFAMLTPDEGFAEVLKYFDIEGAVKTPDPAAAVKCPAPAANDFNVSLDDLLG